MAKKKCPVCGGNHNSYYGPRLTMGVGSKHSLGDLLGGVNCCDNPDADISGIMVDGENRWGCKNCLAVYTHAKYNTTHIDIEREKETARNNGFPGTIIDVKEGEFSDREVLRHLSRIFNVSIPNGSGIVEALRVVNESLDDDLMIGFFYNGVIALAKPSYFAKADILDRIDVDGPPRIAIHPYHRYTDIMLESMDSRLQWVHYLSEFSFFFLHTVASQNKQNKITFVWSESALSEYASKNKEKYYIDGWRREK